jgi:hypothetical protein
MTDLDLVNQALNEVGQKRIVSLDNTISSEIIATANFQLDRIKRAVLRTHDWNCARRRKELDVLDSGLSLGEWAAAYRVPVDCLAVRRFISDIPEVAHAAFSVEDDPDDKKILFTNSGTNKIVYTANLLDVNRWDALLFDACATRLAMQFAITIPRDLKFMETLFKLYQEKIQEAAGVDETEGGIESVYGRDLVTIRWNDGGWW